ncbi:MAG: LytTR family transcriptional regulator [Maricaulaceae bacterium]|nr:LytTR family transcriptional regulator [Maricaulaceae bacterium]
MTVNESHLAREREAGAERAALKSAAITCAAILLVVYAVNALSMGTEMRLAGSTRPAYYPWVLEGTAILAMFIALPLALWLGMRFPFERGRWPTALLIHAGGVLIFGLIQVSLMSAFRFSIWEAVFSYSYTYSDTPFGVFVYEFRKQAASYLGFQVVIAFARALEQSRLEAVAARAEARGERRIALKSGGRSFHPEAAEFLFARAAGNYVEARFGAREHLARMTLSELETLLNEAGVKAARVHRGWVVNLGAVAEVAPTGEGDVAITLKDGQQIPGSRRYRDRLPAR